MEAFARVAARYGVDPADADAVDRFFVEQFASLDEATRDRIFEDILAAEAPADTGAEHEAPRAFFLKSSAGVSEATASNREVTFPLLPVVSAATDSRRVLSDNARRALERVPRGQNPELDRLLDRLDQIVQAAGVVGDEARGLVQTYRGVREE
jgi:hypothetical protein